MAGTIFGLPLSQRVDINGQPLVGWLLYLYVQNSSTPVSSYQDTALTVLNTWPIQADASGMMPQFWLADGSYRVRATNNDGSITLFDIPSVQAIGPSTGTAPSGGVDPNAIFKVGDTIWLDVQGTRTGWVRDNGRTIGSASSGASERQNADCQNLFIFLWNNFSDTLCPVLGGRLANALADWTANKQITLPDKRGVVVGGLSDMGSSSTGDWDSAPLDIGATRTTAGAIVGENTHTLTDAELPSTTGVSGSLGVNISSGQGAHTHSLTRNVQGFFGAGGAGTTGGASGLQSVGQAESATLPAMTGTTSGSMTVNGSDQAHNVVQLTVLGTFYRKL